MRYRHTVGAGVLALASTQCCPSLFLTVTKGDPSPFPVITKPDIAPGPFVAWKGIPNRFDVLGVPFTVDELHEFAAFDPNDSHLSGTSFEALTKIQDKFGIRDLLGVPAQIPVCLVCVGDSCDSALMDQAAMPADTAQVVLSFRGRRHLSSAIRPFEKPEVKPGHKDAFADCEKGVPQLEIEFAGAFRGTTAAAGVAVAPYKPNVAILPLAAFVHVSDIQIRDPSVRLGDRIMSKHLDKLVTSFEYDSDLEHYNPFVVRALIETINTFAHDTSPDAVHPAFVIHTGDAIDSGVTTELHLFHRIIDTLDLPFYDVLGNHDVLSFGNIIPTETKDDGTCGTAISAASAEVSWFGKVSWLLPDKLCVKQQLECPGCLPGEAALVARPTHEGSHASFMAEFRAHPDEQEVQHPPAPAGAVQSEGNKDYCAPVLDDHGNVTEQAIQVGRISLQHGFDLNEAGHVDRDGHPNPPGYYGFAWELPAIPDDRDAKHALYIVLDTNDLDPSEAGSVGRINTRQMKWLKSTLACVQQRHPDDLVFVFGHHGLHDTKPPKKNGKEDTTESVEHVLATSRNVVAYFYGHNHRHGICDHPGSCKHFWEIMAPSVIEFPQEAKMVQIKYAGGGLGFIELQAFGEQLKNHDDAFAHSVALAHAGAERDHCGDHPEDCTKDDRVIRADGHHTSGRLFFLLPRFKPTAPLERKQ